jgi:hypothetical protein
MIIKEHLTFIIGSSIFFIKYVTSVAPIFRLFKWASVVLFYDAPFDFPSFFAILVTFFWLLMRMLDGPTTNNKLPRVQIVAISHSLLVQSRVEGQ